MLARRHRLALHASAAVLISGVAVLATGVGAEADSRPGNFGADATASAVNFDFNRNPPLFPAVQDPVHPQLSYAESQIDSSGGADGLSSSIYPGQTGANLGALLCEFNSSFCAAVVEKLPDYPFQAHAQYPSQPDATAQSSPAVPFPASPLSVTPHSLTAHASPDKVTADAVTEGSSFAGVFTEQSASAHTLETFAAGALVITTQAVVKGVDIGGGAVHIDQITTTATGKLDGAKLADASAVTTASGVTVAGHPATIDSSGIHVDTNGDNGAANAAINSALSKLDASGISIRSLGATKTAKPTKVQAVAGGILVSFNLQANVPTIPVPNLPQPAGNYFGFVTLGGAGVNAFAGPGQNLPNISISVPSVPGTTAAGGAPSAPLPTGVTSANAPAQDPTIAAPPSHRTAGLLAADLTYKKLRTLMLVLLAYPLLFLLSRPLRSPARLPRNG